MKKFLSISALIVVLIATYAYARPLITNETAGTPCIYVYVDQGCWNCYGGTGNPGDHIYTCEADWFSGYYSKGTTGQITITANDQLNEALDAGYSFAANEPIVWTTSYEGVDYIFTISANQVRFTPEIRTVQAVVSIN
jgi:hypothetical protein